MKKSRLLSLDIYRGITIAFMIIVNTPGSWNYVYSPLRHSEWHGCTPTDLVFPSFLFIVGVSMWYSMKKYGHEINTRSLLKILFRTSVIFLAGFLLGLFPFIGKDMSSVRIMGVLQRIALAYGFGALICLLFRRKQLWVVSIIILAGYWALLYFLGGDDPYSLEGNLALRVDRAILGAKHLYKGFGIAFDPEGLLSTIPAVVTVIIGYMSGELVGKGSINGVNALKMVIYGIGAIAIGLIWSTLFPINKPLWTSTYVLFTAGISLILMAFLYLVVDVLKIREWTGFFRVFGVNALFIYIMAGLWTKIILMIKIPAGDESITLYSWIYLKICVPLLGNMNGSLMFALLQVVLMWLLAYILYRKEIYIKV